MDEYEVFDPCDMDREEFNPDLCLLRYAQDCNLPNMLSRRLHLDREIGGLGCDLQNLLLDNYTKFLAASALVSRMRSDLDSMEEEKDLLRSRNEDIVETGAALSSRLRPSEDRMSRLLRGREVVAKKLLPLTELVTMLKQLVESGAHAKAAKHYLKAESLLKKYRHLASLEGIARDCTHIVPVIRSGLLDTLDCDIYGKEELAETLHLLLSLGETPVSAAAHFLSSGRKCLIVDLSLIEDAWKKDLRENNNNQPANAVVNYVSSCCTHVGKIERVVGVMKDVFVDKTDANTMNAVHDLLDEFFFQSIDQLSCQLQQRIVDQFQTMDEDFLSQILDKFNRQCHKLGIVTPQINFHKMGMDIVVRICSARCGFHLQRMDDNFDATVLNTENEISPTTNVQKLLKFMIEWTELKLTDVLKSVSYYMRPEFRFCREASFRNEFYKNLVLEGIFSSFFRHVNDKIWRATSTGNPKSRNSPLMCLVYAKYLSDLKDNVIPKFLTRMDELLCPCEIRSQSSDATILSIFSDTSQKLVEHYTNIRSSVMICMIDKSMQNKNWMECKEPSRPRLVIKMILNELQDLRTEVERILGCGENPRRIKNSPSTRDIGNPVLYRTNSIESLSDQNSIEERILLNKLFKDCSRKRKKVESNLHSILNCVFEKTLRSFVEYVRMHTFNCFGLQQIQVDVHVLQSFASRLPDSSAGPFRSLFDEILSSAYNRSLSAEFMNNQVLSAICSKIV